MIFNCSNSLNIKSIRSERTCAIICHLLIAVFLSWVTLSDLKSISMITVMNDEFGYWSNAAMISGVPWITATQHTPYYSIGYSLILLPLFYLLSTTSLMYKVSIFLNFVFLYGSYFIAYSICRKKLLPNDTLTCVILSISSVLTCSNIYYSQIAWPEVFISFMYWVTILLAIKLEEKYNLRYLILYNASILILYLTHLRTLGLCISSMVFLLLIFRKYKIKWFYFAIQVFVFGGIVLLQRMLSNYQSWLIDNNRITEMNNLVIDGSTVSTYYTRIVTNLKNLSLSMCGKMLVVIFSTLGIAIVLLGNYILSSVIKRKISSNIALTYVVLSSVILIALQAVQAMNGSRKDLVVYSRYMDFIIGPLFLFGVSYLGRCKRLDKIATIVSCISSLCLCTIVNRFSWNASEDGFNAICSPLIGGVAKFTSNHFSQVVIIVFWVMVCFFVLFSALEHMNKSIKVISMCIVFCFFNIAFAYFPRRDTLNYRLKWEKITNDARCLILNNYPNYKITYFCNYSDDVWCTNVKYLQYTLYTKEINIIDIVEETEEITLEDSTLLIISDNDEREYEFLRDAELLLDNSYYSIYKID